MTRGDAEKMLSDLVKKGRRQTDGLLKELERLVRQARKERRRPRRAGPQTGDPGRAPRPQETRLGDRRRPVRLPAARPRRGEQLEVEIDSLAFGGRGVARADGYVVFVAGAPARATASAPR